MPDINERAVQYHEFYYLLGCFPYIDMHIPRDFQPVAGRKPSIVHSAGGWEVQDYGDWLRTSPGNVPYEGYSQMLDMAEEMILLAMERGWPAAYIDGGFYHMVRAAWIAAEILDFPIEGFEPSEDDQRIRLLVERVLTERKKRLQARLEKIRAKLRLTI